MRGSSVVTLEDFTVTAFVHGGRANGGVDPSSPAQRRLHVVFKRARLLVWRLHLFKLHTVRFLYVYMTANAAQRLWY